MVRIGRTVIPGAFIGQMTQESAAEVLAVGSVRISSSCQSAISAKLDQIL